MLSSQRKYVQRFALMIHIVLMLLSLTVDSLDSSPVKIGNTIKSDYKKFAAGAAAFGLIAGKKFIDGPMFNENISLNGKNVLITGANTGLGKETALKLASLGSNTVILCKSAEKAQEAVDDIIQKTGNKQVSSLPLDLANLASVESCAQQVKKQFSDIHVLVNNAGVMAIPERQTTVDGFEKQLGINHLGHFALTASLMGLLLKKDPTGFNKRIVNVASAAHGFSDIDRSDLMLAKAGAYQPWRAYGNTKLSNILFTQELARRFPFDKTGLYSVSCHPGGCRTELGRYIVDPNSIPSYALPILGVVASPLLYFTKSAEQGAQTQIFLSASERLTPNENGRYFDNSAPAGFLTSSAQDSDLAQWLWDESCRLTKARFPNV